MTAAPEDAPVIVAVGNSRLAQNAVAISEPAREHGWRLIILRAPSCPFTPGIPSYSGAECDAHNEAALEYLRALQPDAVALSTTMLPHEGGERIDPVTEETVPTLLDEGFGIIAMRDSPRLDEDPVTCLEEGRSAVDCAQELPLDLLPETRADSALLDELATRGDVHPLDLLPVTCPNRSCAPIIGNVHVMFDVDHTTATYMASAGEETDRQLTEAGFAW